MWFHLLNMVAPQFASTLEFCPFFVLFDWIPVKDLRPTASSMTYWPSNSFHFGLRSSVSTSVVLFHVSSAVLIPLPLLETVSAFVCVYTNIMYIYVYMLTKDNILNTVCYMYIYNIYIYTHPEKSPTLVTDNFSCCSCYGCRTLRITAIDWRSIYMATSTNFLSLHRTF